MQTLSNAPAAYIKIENDNGGKFFTHLFFLSFLLLVPFPEGNDLLLAQYLLNAMLILGMLAYLALKRSTYAQPISLVPLIVFLVCCLTVLFVGFIDLSINLLLLSFKGFLVAFILLTTRTHFSSILKIINFYYLIYVFLSLIFWLDLMPFYRLPYIKNDFLMNYIFFEYYVFFGVEGSPTLIGAYSFFIALINLLFSSNNKVVLLALLCGFISFRVTALAAFALAFVPYYLFRSRDVMLIITATALVVFFALCFYVSMSPYQGEGIDVFLYKITHARNMLWGQFINILLDNYGWSDYLFGGYTLELFSVPVYQENGDFTGAYISNPHSDILLIFLKWPLMAFLFLLLLLYMLSMQKSVKFIVVVFYILLVSMMNSDILSLRNPVYLVVLCALFVSPKQKLFICSHNIGHKSQ